MPVPGEVQVSAGPSKTWFAACAALSLVILAYGLFGNRDASGDLAYQLGYNVPIAIFLAGALHLVFRRRESNRTSWIGVALVYASLVAASVISGNRQKTELRQVAAEIQQAVSAMQSTASAGTTPPPAMPLTNAGDSEVGKMGLVVKTMINRMVAQRREYELELDAIGWSKILDGQRLRGDTTLAESRTMLSQAKDIVEKYRSRTPEIFAQIRRDIESSDLSFGYQQSMLAGFDKSALQGKVQATEIWSLEEQALVQIENAFNLLSAKRSAWQIKDGQVLFHRQADLDLFNSYMSQVQTISAKQEQLQNASLQKSQEPLNQLAN